MLAVSTVAGYLAGTLLAGRLAERMALDRLVLLGLAGSLAGTATAALAAALPPSVVAVVAPMAFTAGLGIVLPVGMAAAMRPSR